MLEHSNKYKQKIYQKMRNLTLFNRITNKLVKSLLQRKMNKTKLCKISNVKS